MRRTGRLMVLFACGASIYAAIEVLWRGSTHRSMLAVGGVCFVLLGLLNHWLSWDTPLELQAVIGAAIVTAVELASGCVVNLWMGLHVWDYSTLPLNFAGQICAMYALLWVPLSAVGIVLDDILRWRLFGERVPAYKLLCGRTIP